MRVYIMNLCVIHTVENRSLSFFALYKNKKRKHVAVGVLEPVETRENPKNQEKDKHILFFAAVKRPYGKSLENFPHLGKRKAHLSHVGKGGKRGMWKSEVCGEFWGTNSLGGKPVRKYVDRAIHFSSKKREKHRGKMRFSKRKITEYLKTCGKLSTGKIMMNPGTFKFSTMFSPPCGKLFSRISKKFPALPFL